MEVKHKTETTTVQKTIVKNVVEFSVEDISDIIKDYVRNQGYYVVKVNFEIDSKYRADEWGMNGYTSHSLKGATLEVEEVGE